MKTKLAILSMAGLLTTPALADIQINGFANLIGGMTLDDDESVYDYDSDFNFNPASVFGLQVRGDVSDKLSATAQLVGRGSDDYDAESKMNLLKTMLAFCHSNAGPVMRMNDADVDDNDWWCWWCWCW